MGTAQSQRTYGGKPIAVRRAERRAAFLEAGLTLFGDKGFTRTSISDICTTANLARSQFYTEFPDRETLLIGVYEHIQIHMRAAVVAALENLPPAASFEEVAAAGIEALFESLGSDHRRATVIFVEMNGVSDRVVEYRTQCKQVWAHFFEVLVRSHVGENYVPPGGYAIVAAAVTGAVREVCQMWSGLDPRPPLGDFVGVMTAIVHALVPSPNT